MPPGQTTDFAMSRPLQPREMPGLAPDQHQPGICGIQGMPTLSSRHLSRNTIGTNVTGALGQNYRSQAVCPSDLLRDPYVLDLSSDYSSYCVRPNSGHIEPGKAVEVQGWSIRFRTNKLGLMVSIVLLQVLKDAPAPGAKCKDKFLVQAVPVAPGQEQASVTQIVRSAVKVHNTRPITNIYV